MRILLLVDCYLPGLQSSGKLIHDLAEEMNLQGHAITILTPSESIPHTFEVTHEDGLRIVRVKTPPVKTAPRFLRALREMRLSQALWKCAGHFLEANPMDLVIFYSPTIFWGHLVKRLKAMWKCPAYLILRDIFPQWAVDAGILRKRLIWRYFRAKEIEQYELADLIGVESPANLKYFAEHFPSRYRLEVLYNWASLGDRELPPSGLRAKLNLENKVVFLYGGNLGIVQDLDNLIRLAINLEDHPRIHFVLVGNGSESSRLQRVISRNKLTNIKILSAVREPEYLAMLSESDVGLISLSGQLKTYNMTGKILGYMYCGKPVLASVNAGNDLFSILERNRAGICCVNGEDDDLKAAALRLATDVRLRRKMGENSRKLLEAQFSARAAAGQILTHVESISATAKTVASNRGISVSPHSASESSF